ncbi:sulfur oxidation c-type cytochrome SoxX [Bordetella petrii]|uniref:sulfur oxidation c-type cytochrome SoxX n=1 Tax=Bordetella petrii TaxID=94624 RepID=UPI00372F6B0C
MYSMYIRLVQVVGAALALQAAAAAAQPSTAARPDPAQIVAELKASFKEKGIAKLDRIDQTEMQRACSRAAADGTPLPGEVAARISQESLASVKRPADGVYLGDWKAGEKVAQNGRGLQFSDTAKTVNGGNCYACHQMTKAEISFGNIGPSLYQYGKLRGASKEMVEYTWNKIYNSHAYMPCSNMPRFGAAGILTEQQLKDVMALLLDPASPVNDDNAPR